MKRKVLQVGRSSLAVSLPSKWVKQHDLAAGDDLEVLEGSALTISKGVVVPKKKSAAINIGEMSYFTLSRRMSVYYRLNYERVTLNIDKSDIYHHKHGRDVNVASTIKKIVSRFIGAEIISHTNKAIEVEFFVAEDLRDLEKIERRVHYLFKETFAEMLEAITAGTYRQFHETVYDRHDNITKFINYYLRMLESSDKPSEEKEAAYALYVLLDKIVDKIRHISDKIDQHGCDKTVAKCLSKIFDFFTDQFVYLSRNDSERALVEKRYGVLKSLQDEGLTLSQQVVVGEASILLDTLTLFVELKMIRDGLVASS